MKFKLKKEDDLTGTLSCCKCNHAFTVKDCRVVVDDASMSEANAISEKGKHFSYACPACGHEAFAPHDFLYILNSFKINGSEFGQWAIKFADTRNIAEDFVNEIKEARKNPENEDNWTTYRVRVCFTPKDFIEKIRVIIALSDDRVIEVIRNYQKNKLEKQTGKKIVYSEFMVDNPAEFGFLYEFEDETTKYCQINKDVYLDGLALAEKIGLMDNDDEIIVDEDTVQCAMRKLNRI